MTVLENLMVGRHALMRRGCWPAASVGPRASARGDRAPQAVEEIIDLLEIADVRRKHVGMLPYGLQKRVELGRALALEPRLLLLDEPMAGMNAEEKEDMVRFILDVNQERGVTCRADRARHGRGHGHLRPGGGAGLRPQDRRGNARPRCAGTPK